MIIFGKGLGMVNKSFWCIHLWSLEHTWKSILVSSVNSNLNLRFRIVQFQLELWNLKRVCLFLSLQNYDHKLQTLFLYPRLCYVDQFQVVLMDLLHRCTSHNWGCKLQQENIEALIVVLDSIFNHHHLPYWRLLAHFLGFLKAMLANLIYWWCDFSNIN